MSVASTPALEQRLTSQAPRMVLLVGIVSCALLGGLIWLLTRLRSQAESLAQSMTKKLTEQTRFTEDLIEHNPNPIFRKDTRGRFVSVNRAWEELTGHARTGVVGKLYADLMPVDIATANEVHDLALLASPEAAVPSRPSWPARTERRSRPSWPSRSSRARMAAQKG